MSGVRKVPYTSYADFISKLNFHNKLEAITSRIYAAIDDDKVFLQDICNLFGAERLTIYVVTEDGRNIVAKVQTGLDPSNTLKLRIAPNSIAGYVALRKKMLNIKNAYDGWELRTHDPRLRFFPEVDKRTGYRTKQVLCAPIVDAQSNLFGVVQIINRKGGLPFGQLEEKAAFDLTWALAKVFRHRQAIQPIKAKYGYLIAEAVVSQPELALATYSALRKGIDVEDVLINEFRVKIPVMGAALSTFFGVPYEPFKADRAMPPDLLKNLKREYVDSNQWLPVDDSKDGLVIMCPDPERVKSSRIVNNVFPEHRLVFRVTTLTEFRQTVNQCFEQDSIGDVQTGDIRESLDDKENALASGADDVSAPTESEVVKLVKE